LLLAIEFKHGARSSSSPPGLPRDASGARDIQGAALRIAAPVMLLRPAGRPMALATRLAMVRIADGDGVDQLPRPQHQPWRLEPHPHPSAWTLVQVSLIVRAARAHDVARHRRRVRGMVTGALLISGFFTFPFGRMLGSWLFA
jgi:hypothetical protein